MLSSLPRKGPSRMPTKLAGYQENFAGGRSRPAATPQPPRRLASRFTFAAIIYEPINESICHPFELERAKVAREVSAIGRGAYAVGRGRGGRSRQWFDGRLCGHAPRALPRCPSHPARPQLWLCRGLQPGHRADHGGVHGAAQHRRRGDARLAHGAARGVRRRRLGSGRATQATLPPRPLVLRVCRSSRWVDRSLRISLLSWACAQRRGGGSRTVRHAGRHPLGIGRVPLHPHRRLPPCGRAGRALLRPPGGDRPLLATPLAGLSPALHASVGRLPRRRRHTPHGEPLQDVPQLPQQPADDLQEPARP